MNCFYHDLWLLEYDDSAISFIIVSYSVELCKLGNSVWFLSGFSNEYLIFPHKQVLCNGLALHFGSVFQGCLQIHSLIF